MKKYQSPTTKRHQIEQIMIFNQPYKTLQHALKLHSRTTTAPLSFIYVNIHVYKYMRILDKQDLFFAPIMK